VRSARGSEQAGQAQDSDTRLEAARRCWVRIPRTKLRRRCYHHLFAGTNLRKMDACCSLSAFSIFSRRRSLTMLASSHKPFGIDLLNGNFPRAKQTRQSGCSPDADITSTHELTMSYIRALLLHFFLLPSSSSHPRHLHPRLSTCTFHQTTTATNLCSSFTHSCVVQCSFLASLASSLVYGTRPSNE